MNKKKSRTSGRRRPDDGFEGGAPTAPPSRSSTVNAAVLPGEVFHSRARASTQNWQQPQPDRGSKPLIAPSTLTPTPPRNISDEEKTEDTADIMPTDEPKPSTVVSNAEGAAEKDQKAPQQRPVPPLQPQPVSARSHHQPEPASDGYVRNPPGAFAMNNLRSSVSASNDAFTTTNSLQAPQPTSLLHEDLGSPIVATVVASSMVSSPSTLPSYNPANVTWKQLLKDPRVRTILCLSTVIICGLIAGLVVFGLQNGNSGATATATPTGREGPVDIGAGQIPTEPPAPTNTGQSPSPAPLSTIQPTMALEGLLIAASPDGGLALQNETSPQRLALEWLMADPNINDYGPDLAKERYAVAVMEFEILQNTVLSRRRYLMPANAIAFLNYTTPTCDLVYIECNPSGRVTTYNLDYSCLRFTLLEELTLLTELEILKVSNNEAYGAIPTLYGTFTKLKDMYLNDNDLTGKIPTELAQMTQLVHFDVSRNTFIAGPIPTEIALMNELERFSASTNKLTGTLAPELGSMKTLCYLEVNENSMTGTLPTELGKLTIIKDLILWGNHFNGTIPSELGNLADAHLVFLSSNKLTGTIPGQFKSLQQIYTLDLADNFLIGTVPIELTFLTNMGGTLALNMNQLNGTIPTELGRLRYISDLVLSDNQFIGTIPTQFGYFTDMYGSIVLSNNNLFGRLPSELGNLSNLYGLYLANNAGLTGTIPSEFGNMTGLRELIMFNNGMNGSVPEKLCELYGNDKNFTRLEVDCDISCSCCDGFCF